MAKAAKIQKPLRNNPGCTRCTLHKKAKTCCCETTNLQKRGGMLLIGEALGASEDEVGRPFVGDAGRKLNYCLARAGIKRKTLSIGNVVRCRPPKNKTPTKTQIDSCYPYLWHDILKLKPKVIVAMGSVAFQTLLADLTTGPKETLKLRLSTKNVSEWRGFPERRTFRWTTPKGKVVEHTCWVVPTYHPSAALHSWEKDDLIVFDLRMARQLLAGKKVLKKPGTKVRVATTLHQALALLRKLRRVGPFVTDLETTGLSPHLSRILCAGFCYKEGHADILPLRAQDDKPFWRPEEFRLIVAELTELLEDAELIGQNLKFDIGHYRKLTGIVEYNVVDDTILLHHVLCENKPHNLTFLCQWYLRWEKYDAALDPYKYNKGKKRILDAKKVPNELLWQYCGYDVDGTWQVRKKLKPKVAAEGLQRAYKIELDLTVPLSDIEYRGINADKTKLLQLSSSYRKTCAGLECALQKSAMKTVGVMRNKRGEKVPFNPRSSMQMGVVLKKCGAELNKKTQSGQAAVDKFVLAGLATKNTKAGRLAKKVTELRKAEKILSTYLDGKEGTGGFRQHLVEHTGSSRWHANYNIFIARTGRLSADDPAIQTLPRSAALRSMVIPDNPDHKIIAVDYEKIELCVMSWLANDGVMVDELLSGVDLHTKMAVTARLMRNPTDAEFEKMRGKITKDERAVAKGVNFGIPYGRGAYAVAIANPEAFPANMIQRDRTRQVQRVIDAYFEKYHGIAEYRELQSELMQRDGKLRSTLFGRIRHLHGVRWFKSKHAEETEHRGLDFSHMENEAYNFETQSIASMILNKKTKVVYDGIKKARLPGFRIILSLHDALIFNVHHSCTEEAIVLIKRWMETKLPRTKHHKYEVPLKVEALVQNYWGEEYAAEEK